MITCTKFHKVEKGCLRGFASLYVNKWDIEIHSCSLNEKDGSYWVSIPSQMYEKDGVKKYSPYITFKDGTKYKAFMEVALAAILKVRDSTKGIEVEEIPF